MQVSAFTMVMHNGDGAPGAECSLLFPEACIIHIVTSRSASSDFNILTCSQSQLQRWSVGCRCLVKEMGYGYGGWWEKGKGKGWDARTLVILCWAWQKQYIVLVTIGFPWYFGYPTSWSCSVAHLFVPMTALLDSSLILVRGRYMAREGQRPRQRSRQGSGQRPPTQSQGSTFPCQKRERRGCNICPQRAFSKKGMRRRSDHSGSQDILHWLGNTVEKYGWPSSTSIACSDEW